MGSAPVFAQQLNPADRSAAEAAIKTIRAQAIRAHMRFLSDSLLEGRAPGTRGYDIAAQYVATQMEAMGLRPAGVNGTWFQPVPLRKAVNDASRSSYVLVGDGKEQKLADTADYVFGGDLLRAESSVEAPLVFVGFGATAPEMNYDDYAGANVRNKIVVLIQGAPPRFPSTVRAYYSSRVVKEQNAVAHGAAGTTTILLPEDQKRVRWDWIVPQIKAGQVQWLDAARTPHDVFPELRVGALFSQHGAEMLFAGAPKTLDQAFAAARANQPQAFPLASSARIHRVSTHTEFESPNIIAKLEGSDPALRDQYVVYTAHVDHLGLCPPVEGDKVCHGAWDNASGTASLLEIARAFTSLPRSPRRSVLFVFVTGEEMGLLGSDYFAHFPAVLIENIIANLNIDGSPSMLTSSKYLTAYGGEHSSLGKNAESAAQQVGYKISPDLMPEEVLFIRSDQYSFVLQGVPSLFIIDGADGLDVGRKWLTTKYHTPLDNVNQPLDYESGARGARMNFLVGYEVAQQDQPPAWNEGDFFGSKFGRGRAANTRK
ncbi:MAG: M28 family peptidase [Acidobacteria bacterium]|nr:M28 family peptidase [Acidobacteriota bacterium]